MNTAKATLIDTNARAGEVFVKEYFYRVYDSSRHELFRFYREDSMLIWNGNTKKGLQTLRDFFQQLPPSTHNIQSIDCQPIADGTDTPQASNIFVVVVGTVTYAKEDPRHFHQTFILAQEPGKGTYYIVNDCFRLTTGPVS